MEEIQAYQWSLLGYPLLALATLGILLWRTAPYGRHRQAGWGPTIPVRAGWLIMEWPASLGFGLLFFWGDHQAALVPRLLAGLWLAHYLHRSFIYPLRIRASGKRMPLVVALLGMGFQLFNSWLCVRAISHMAPYAADWIWDPRLWLGVALFGAGQAINLHSDEVLRRLRGPGETGYKIPRGGLYRWVSSPNYLGELLAWTGWALASWRMAGLGFALYTAANLVPRALAHHRWYRQTFPDYPPSRRAIFPGLL